MIARRAFGVKLGEADRLSVEQARQISSVMGMRMVSDDFLRKVDAAIGKLGKDPEPVDRQRALLECVLPMQMEVMKDFGFEGDPG